MSIKSVCSLRILQQGRSPLTPFSYQSSTASLTTCYAKINKKVLWTSYNPAYSCSKPSRPSLPCVVFRRSFTSKSLSDFTPDEYVKFPPRRKNYITVLLGMQALLRKLNPDSELPHEIIPETWEYFLSVLEENKKLFIDLPSITRNSPFDWIDDDFRDILRTIPKYLYHLEPLPIFHAPEYQKKLYETIEDKFWGQMEYAAPASVSYEHLEEDHQIVCNISAARIRSGETLIDICSWNGELLLPTALKAQEAGKIIELLGVNLTKEGLILTRLSAQAIKLDQRLSLGLGNVIYPLILPKTPKVIMNTRVLSSLTEMRGKAFVKNNLFPLLQEQESVAFLSAALQEGPEYSYIKQCYEEVAHLEDREFDMQPVYLDTEKKHQIGVSYFQRDGRFDKKFRLLQTYYSLHGLHMLMHLENLKITNHTSTICKARRKFAKDSQRVVIELKHLKK